MSGTEESDPEWGEEKSITKQIQDSSLKGAFPVQKFCENWLSVFNPWLARCTENPNKPFCRACQCRLDCNRCHLQRHERTSKHARNLVIFLEKGEEGARQNYSMRQERSKYYQQRKKSNSLLNSSDMRAAIVKEENEDGELVEENYDEDESFDFVSAETTEEHYEDELNPKQKHGIQIRNSMHNTNAATIPQRKNPATLKKERMKLLMQIQKDKNDLMSTFKDLIGGGNKTVVSTPKEKNHVDLFFESVSSSVKALSPKLIAEAKMRVSQLICELELRALTEGDSNNRGEHIVAPDTIVVSPSAGNSYVLHRSVHQNTAENQQHHDEHVVPEYEALT